MSSSEAEAEEEFSTSRLQDLLVDLYDDLTESAIKMQELSRSLKKAAPYGLYRKKQTLIPAAAKLFHVKEASLKDLLNFWLPLWKDEGRVKNNKVRLGGEAWLLGLEPDIEVDVYTLCEKMSRLFVKKI